MLRFFPQVVPIFIWALMQSLSTPQPPPPPRFQTFICRKVFICTLERTFKWWMENVKHCTHLLLLAFSLDVDWHHEDLSLFETVIFSLLLPLHFCGCTHADPSPWSFLYVYSTAPLFKFWWLTLEVMWRFLSGVSIKTNVWASARRTLFKNKTLLKVVS